MRVRDGNLEIKAAAENVPKKVRQPGQPDRGRARGKPFGGARIVNGYLEPDLSSAVLLTIDAQRDFTLPGTAEVVPGMRWLVRDFRQSNRPVVHV